MEALTLQDFNALRAELKGTLTGLEERLQRSIAELRRETVTVKGRNILADGDEIGGLDLFCRLTGLSKSTGYMLAHLRKVPHSKVGQRIYFKRSEVEAWIEQGRRPLVSEEVEQRMAG